MKIDDLRVPKGYDKRIKITPEKKEMVFSLREKGISQRAIAEEVGISRRSVIYILYPEKLEHSRKLYKERRKDGRYYNKEKHRIFMKSHRDYKKKLSDELG
jgi:orotate phosphoribosyltransferase-like protein